LGIAAIDSENPAAYHAGCGIRRWRLVDASDGENKRMRLCKSLLLPVFAVISVVAAAPAETLYPTRPVTLVIPVPPGGGADFVGRLVGAKLADALGQPVVINNRGGAGGTIATAGVAKAEPDGYTLLLNSITTHGIGPHLYANLPYDPAKDFSPVIFLANLPLIMTVNAALPVKTVGDVIAFAKARPGELAFASSGIGGAPHLAGELFKTLTGIDLLHVPYRGSGPAVIDVVAGRVAIMFDAVPSLLPFILADKLRPLAAASAGRNRRLPDIPTFAELGYPQMDISLWYGVVAPAGTPQPVVRRLNTELARILEMPDIRASFAQQGADPTGGTPEAFAGFMRTESARWREVVSRAGIKPE
jgi:tripartite-type tricarboxylate transporter receptor subunit TctC